MKLTKREKEIIYFALSRALNNTEGFNESNEIINLREKFKNKGE